MASVNKVMLLGNLTGDPELKQIPSGTSVADLRLAVSENYKSKAGEDVESVVFVDVVTWGVQAENCAKHLSKGSQIFVEGKLQLDQWEKDGQKRSKIRVRAIVVHFMGSKGDNSQSPSATQPRQSAADVPSPDYNAPVPDEEPPF